LLNILHREGLSVGAATDALPALNGLRIDPGYSINDQQSLHIVRHSSTALDYSAFIARPSLFSTPRHR
jgi:hypothetical protein